MSMTSSTLSVAALSVIDRYLHFKVGGAVCSVPYFNNKTVKARGSLAVHVGKGSPDEITDEVKTDLFKHHIDAKALADESLKKLMVDYNVGIDCSGFIYHVLDAESEERGKGPLSRNLAASESDGIFGKLVFAMRPAKNTSVAVFSSDHNSRIVPLSEVEPGDMVTMTDEIGKNARNHVLIVHEVERQEGGRSKIRYSHAVAYPEDGVYSTGVKQGEIEIIDLDAPVTDQLWREGGKEGDNNLIFMRAKKSRTEIRRLKWL